MASTTAPRTGLEYSGIPEVPSGSKLHSISPPPEASIISTTERDQGGEAAHTIPGECERLFCDKLCAIFLGERRLQMQESLGIGAPRLQRISAVGGNQHIQQWIEVLDYTSDSIYRGFITNVSGERTLFVFLAENALCPGFKTGLIALFELADLSAFACSRIVACSPRSDNVTELEVVRNLGWCGFSLTTLQPWDTERFLDSFISARWLFLSAEV